MSPEARSELLQHELRLLELRRATRDLEQKRVSLVSEKQALAREIEDLLAELQATPPG